MIRSKFPLKKRKCLPYLDFPHPPTRARHPPPARSPRSSTPPSLCPLRSLLTSRTAPARKACGGCLSIRTTARNLWRQHVDPRRLCVDPGDGGVDLGGEDLGAAAPIRGRAGKQRGDEIERRRRCVLVIASRRRTTQLAGAAAEGRGDGVMSSWLRMGSAATGQWSGGRERSKQLVGDAPLPDLWIIFSTLTWAL